MPLFLGVRQRVVDRSRPLWRQEVMALAIRGDVLLLYTGQGAADIVVLGTGGQLASLESRFDKI